MSGRLAYDETVLRGILCETRTIAVVGASPKPARASNYVMAFLQSRGYRTIPVNPGHVGNEINGEAVFARLAEVPGPVDLVDVFRNSVAAGDIVDEAIALKDRLGIRTIWMQIGVRNEPAAERAEAAGLKVVMDRCPKVDYPRLFGSARLSQIGPGGLTV